MHACCKCRELRVVKRGHTCEACKTPLRRPLSEDGAYARELGVRNQTVKRLGGAAYLKSLPQESRNLLFKQLALHGSYNLTKRGMTAQPPCVKAFKPQKTEWPVDRMVVAEKMVAYEAKF